MPTAAASPANNSEDGLQLLACFTVGPGELPRENSFAFHVTQDSGTGVLSLIMACETEVGTIWHMSITSSDPEINAHLRYTIQIKHEPPSPEYLRSVVSRSDVSNVNRSTG